MTLEEKKEALIQTEWEQFQKVQNEGGRASCQDDPETFFLQRRSRLTAWTGEMVESWHLDLKAAEAAGRNLLAEKYAWMMKSTAPEEFEKLKRLLRQPSPAGEQMIEELVKIQVAWMEEYKEQYPFLAAGNRAIHSSEDTPHTTSFETYSRGELSTYSEQTLHCCLEMVKKLQREGQNMAVLIMDATARAYGYADIDAAEARERQRKENVICK